MGSFVHTITQDNFLKDVLLPGKRPAWLLLN